MECTIEQKQNGALIVAKPRGTLNAVTAPELEQTLIPELENANELVMDLSDVENISSMGLRLLLSLYRSMEKRGTMRVTNARGAVAEVFELSGFSEIFGSPETCSPDPAS